jgi:hypothetical protein
MTHLITFLFPCLFLVPLYVHGQTDVSDLTWPRELVGDQYTTILYQPQFESFVDNVLTGRMAVAIQQVGAQDLVFGALWFAAQLDTDLDERIVVLKSLDIGQTRFPDVEQDQIDAFARRLETEIEGRDLVMSLDRLLATLEMAEQEEVLAAGFNNAPPHIFYRENSAALIYIDGEPILKETEDENIQYVVNTPYFIVWEEEKNIYYIKGGAFWYASNNIQSGWTEVEQVPRSIEKMADKVVDKDGKPADSLLMEMDRAPEIIVATEPAELIITDGAADYAPIDGTSLLFVKNTESDIILNIQNQTHYALLAGRWYASKSLKDGSWSFVEPKTLPEDFRRIPEESTMANVRPSIPGTDEAQAAVLEQTIPQTATVNRKTATTDVSYDGNPKFERIDKTEVARAVNSDKTVLLIKNTYYVVDNAVWFQSDNATGPWQVCVDRPDEVDDIPPESEAYNVKYVYIYDHTPDVVYVGYTPGYTWSYVYGGVVVYGTGWYYRPWYGSVYYPRPVTWGFHVHYNPWTGWGFSFGLSYGWFSMGWHSPYHGWWGPAGYRH